MEVQPHAIRRCTSQDVTTLRQARRVDLSWRGGRPPGACAPTGLAPALRGVRTAAQGEQQRGGGGDHCCLWHGQAGRLPTKYGGGVALRARLREGEVWGQRRRQWNKKVQRTGKGNNENSESSMLPLFLFICSPFTDPLSFSAPLTLPFFHLLSRRHRRVPHEQKPGNVNDGSDCAARLKTGQARPPHVDSWRAIICGVLILGEILFNN